MKKNILVAGVSGYVGGIIAEFLSREHNIYGLSREISSRKNSFVYDLRDKNNLKELARKVSPDLIIHAAGNKDIKFCENNSDEAYAANELGVINLLDIFSGKKIIYISSDYVFSGDRGKYSENDVPNPRTVYGKSKLAGEEYGIKNSDNFFVLRSSAIYNKKAAFLSFLNRELTDSRPVDCFVNTFYSPTYYEDFLAVLDKLVINDGLPSGIYHSCGERVSRYDFAFTYAKVFGLDSRLIKENFADKDHWFLFPDLSLENKKTNEKLGLGTTGLEESFLKMKLKD